MISPLEAFLFGAAGSSLIELIDILAYYRRGRLPERYHKVPFWVSRVALVIGSGIIAYAHDVQTKILAVHLGAATPLILQAFKAAAPVADPTTPTGSAPPRP